MHDEIREAFEQIHATEQMKQSVSEYLAQNRRKTARGSIRLGLRPLVSICALLLICIGLGNGYFWEMPVSYLSVDVNPSIELTLNRKNQVTDVQSRNKEGELILKDVQLKGKDYLEAVEMLMECDNMQPYLTRNAEVTVTVASSKAEELLSGFASSPVTTYYHGLCRSMDMETVASAHDHGMSLGKYQMYQLLSQYDSGLTTEDCQNISMCRLSELLSQYENGREEPVNSEELNSFQESCNHNENGNHHHGNGHHRR